MTWRSLSARLVAFSVFVQLASMEALAQFGLPQFPTYRPPGAPGGPTVVGTPEIDGPAGVAALALLVTAGIIAYNRYRK